MRPIRPDVVFPKQRIALFIDGCFWHGCPEHGTLPATNVDYWLPKIEENRARDARHNAELTAAGWTVVRAWEHEDPAAVANKVASLVRAHSHPPEPTQAPGPGPRGDRTSGESGTSKR
jgi:DNA mismatch endonuclease (patch repair protein)